MSWNILSKNITLVDNTCGDCCITYPINSTDFIGNSVSLLDEFNITGDMEDFWTCHRALRNGYLNAYDDNTMQTWLDNNLIIEEIQCGRLFKFNCSGLVFLEKKYGCTDVYLTERNGYKYTNSEIPYFIETFSNGFNTYVGLSNLDNSYILQNNCNVSQKYDTCGDTCISINDLNGGNLISTDSFDKFNDKLTSEFIDAKNRQTISSYPTLRAVYDRYLNSSDYSSNVSSAFDYQNMDRFAGLIGNYWIDLIEQVVPSTTIWGSVKIYTNTIFDEQKFKYKSYSSLLCKNPFVGQKVLSPINGVSGQCQVVNVIYKDLLAKAKSKTDDSYTTNLVGERVMMSSESDKPTTSSFDLEDYPTTKPIIDRCDNLCIAQMNSGSEFISYIQLPSLTCNNDGNTQSNIQESGLNVKIQGTAFGVDRKILKAVTVGGTTPFTYLWSNGETTETINLPINDNTIYSVTVTDVNCNSVKSQEWDYFYNRH
jgi:hypothetical protein